MAERILGIDFDDTLVETTAYMRESFEERFPGRFDRRNYDRGTDEMLGTDYSDERRVFLKNTGFISSLPLSQGAISAVSILWTHFDRIHINSARWEDQRPDIEKLLEEQKISKHIHSILLRPVDGGDQSTVKMEAAEKAGINYAIEDHTPLAVAFAEKGIKVALIDRPWNRKAVLSSPNIKRYARILDFAFELISHGNPEELFAKHQLEREVEYIVPELGIPAPSLITFYP